MYRSGILDRESRRSFEFLWNYYSCMCETIRADSDNIVTRRDFNFREDDKDKLQVRRSRGGSMDGRNRNCALAYRKDAWGRLLQLSCILCVTVQLHSGSDVSGIYLENWPWIWPSIDRKQRTQCQSTAHTHLELLRPLGKLNQEERELVL